MDQLVVLQPALTYMDGESFHSPSWYNNILSEIDVQTARTVDKVPDQFQDGEIYLVPVGVEGSLVDAYKGSQLRELLKDGRQWKQTSGAKIFNELEALYLKERRGSYHKRLYKRNSQNLLLVHYGTMQSPSYTGNMRIMIDDVKVECKKAVAEMEQRMMAELKRMDEANTHRLDEMKSMYLRYMNRMTSIEANLMNTMKQLGSGKPNQFNEDKTKGLSMEDMIMLKGFSPKVVEIIDELVDVDADGHCGYHALALALDIDQERERGWIVVRQKMLSELRSHSDLYKAILQELYDPVIEAIECFEPKCSPSYYFKLPWMACIAASCFQCPLVVLTACECHTYLPTRGSPGDSVKVIAIAMFDNHVRKVSLKPQSPIPPNSPFYAVDEWKRIVLPRLLAEECAGVCHKNKQKGSLVVVDK